MARQTPAGEDIELTRYGDARHERIEDEETGNELRAGYGPPQHEVEPPDPAIAERIQYEDNHWTDWRRGLNPGPELPEPPSDVQTIPC